MIQIYRSTGRRLSLAPLAVALGGLTSLGTAAGPASQLQRPSGDLNPSSRVVRLPSETQPEVLGAEEKLDGHHLRWVGEGRYEYMLSLGPAVPTRTLVSTIEQRIAQDGARDAGISVEDLGSVLLVRGSSATPADALQRAATTAEEAITEFHSLTNTLEFRTSVSLVASGDGVEDAVLIQAVRPIAAGQRAVFGERTERSFVGDFNVEVASGQSIADPVIASVETGETLHLWASTTLQPDGLRQLHVQGLLDVAIETGNRTFDPSVYELGVLEQPIVRAVQVMFAGTVPADGPLVVTLDGMGGDLPQRRLEISAPAWDPAQHPGVDSQGAIDLSRGMWRGFLGQRHALTDPRVKLQLPEGRMPASAAQLMALSFGRQELPRPDLGSSALFLHATAAPSASTSFPAVQALFRSIDPTGPNLSFEVVSESGDFRATLPATLGAMIRVARTQETVLVLDYTPQIANDAKLADPQSEIFLYGEILEGVLELRGGRPQLVGSATRRVLSALRTREVDPLDTGRIQQPMTVCTSAKFSVKGGGEAAAAGLKLRLE